MEFTIGTADTSDMEGIRRLYEQLGVGCDDPELMRKTYEKMLKNKDCIIIVAKNKDGTVIGAVNGYACRIICWGCTCFMAIEDIVVDEKYRKQGIGKAMMARLDEFAAEHDCSYAILVSTDSEARIDAHRFYEGLGYNKERKVKGFRKTYRKTY